MHRYYLFTYSVNKTTRFPILEEVNIERKKSEENIEREPFPKLEEKNIERRKTREKWNKKKETLNQYIKCSENRAKFYIYYVFCYGFVLLEKPSLAVEREAVPLIVPSTFRYEKSKMLLICLSNSKYIKIHNQPL